MLKMMISLLMILSILFFTAIPVRCADEEIYALLPVAGGVTGAVLREVLRDKRNKVDNYWITFSGIGAGTLLGSYFVSRKLDVKTGEVFLDTVGGSLVFTFISVTTLFSAGALGAHIEPDHLAITILGGLIIGGYLGALIATKQPIQLQLAALKF